MPVVCRPEVGQCPAVSAPVAAGTPAAAVPEVAGNPEVADDEEGAACGRHKQFCGPTRDRGHSNCRK